MSQDNGRQLNFGSKGFLAPGIHDCTLDELRRLVATNSHRQQLWIRLVNFLAWPVLITGFSHAYIAGGFVSRKEKPADIDVILQTQSRFGPSSFSAIERFFQVGLDNIREMYAVDLHFWMDGAPDSIADYRTFFQYQRPKGSKNLSFRSKGIVRFKISDPEIKTHLKRHMMIAVPVATVNA